MNANRKRAVTLALVAAAIVALVGIAALLRNVDVIGYIKRLHGG